MYLYSFSLWNNRDRVFFYEDASNLLSAGDFVHNDDGYFLVLGEEMSFPELCRDKYLAGSPFFLVEKDFFSQSNLEMLHRMTYQRYAPYKTVIKLFINTEVQELLKKKPKSSPKNPQKSELIVASHHLQVSQGQILLVFPDLWTRENTIKYQKNVLTLNSQDTQNKKDTNWRKIKTGEVSIITATSAEIFQDYHNLQQIFFVEPQKRYYANQQDPRYKVSSVLEQLSVLHHCPFQIILSEELY